MTLFLAHHELAAHLGAYVLGLSGASVAVLWRASTRPRIQRLRQVLAGRAQPRDR